MTKCILQKINSFGTWIKKFCKVIEAKGVILLKDNLLARQPETLVCLRTNR